MPAWLVLAASLSAVAAPRASSELTREDVRYRAANAFDGLLSTSWAEGDSGSGEGAWIEVDLGRTTQLTNVTVWPGNLAQGKRSHRESASPSRLQVYVDGKPQGEPVRVDDGLKRVEIPVTGSGRRVRVEATEAREGFVYQDLHIAEIAINYPSNDGGTTRRLDQWLASKDAERKAEVFKQSINDAYSACKDAEFGDRDSLAYLMDAVADGPQFIRPMVARYVPDGFRAQAITSTKRAQKALRKLKDPNGIPAFEMAALRATGTEEARLEEMVEIFYAYQDLIGTENRNVGYWGEPGNVLGALQSFGEPINVEVDRDGRVYVADIGNNRIQRFGPKGRPQRQWGPARDITNEWFQGSRDWYASGSKAGTDSGSWVTPIDLDLIPGKEDDGFVGIDALGRVQVYKGDGTPRISWTVETKKEPGPSVGGEAYVAWVPKKKRLVTIMENEAVVYTLDSEEVGRFKLPDGVPNAVEVTKKGNLLMGYGREIIRYSVDGFRFGTVIPYDMLDEGFEDMDISLDEEGAIWVLTDTGYVHKFKSPKKKEWSLKVIDRPLTHPRFAVRQGVVYIVSDDQIERIDAYQLKLDKEAAEAEAAKQKDEG